MKFNKHYQRGYLYIAPYNKTFVHYQKNCFFDKVDDSYYKLYFYTLLSFEPSNTKTLLENTYNMLIILPKKGVRFSSHSFCIILHICKFSDWQIVFYSSSSKLIASFVVINVSYSSLLPTIMFSKSRNPVPAGI
jgi:hypothetical protein